MAQPAVQTAKEPKWSVSLDPKKYVNSAAISGDGARVVAGTFFHAYKPSDLTSETLPEAAPGPDQFGTYCFDSDGNQLWVDQFNGYEGVYAVAISDDGSVAASGGWYSYSPLQGFIRAYKANDGTRLLSSFIGSRVNQLALSADGRTLVAAADKLYLFQQTNGVFPQKPAFFPKGGSRISVQSVATSADGTSVVFGDAQGNVYLLQNNDGEIGAVAKWNDPSLTVVHAVAMSAGGKYFVAVGSSQFDYLFTPASIQSGQPYATYDSGSVTRAGWVAIDGSGGLISVVRNAGIKGAVYALLNEDETLKSVWSAPTLANPNSTSIDSNANYVTVADGYPDNTPGHFYLFDAASGDAVWQYPTTNMNWPMAISSDGAGIVGGSDLGTVYYFTPE